jgi:hypothetical protein
MQKSISKNLMGIKYLGELNVDKKIILDWISGI